MTELSRSDWLAQRRTGIGGSDVAAILGLSKFKSPLDVFKDKLGETPDGEQSQAAYWGTKLEDIVAKEFQERTGLKVQRVNKQLSRERWMHANIDRAVVNPAISGTVRVQDEAKQVETGRLLTTDAILECKTASSYIADQWGPSQESEIIAGNVVSDHKIPIYYETQVQWYLGVTGASVCYVAALLGGQDFRIYRVERDDEVIAALQEQCRSFWFEHVQKHVPPEPHTAEEVQKLFAKDDGEMVEATNEVATDIGELRNLVEQVKALEAEQKIVKDRICAALGEKTGFLIAGEKACTFKAQKSTRFDTTRFKKEQPETYATYVKTSETRVFRLSA
jgi:putative phage-type endonuclease